MDRMRRPRATSLEHAAQSVTFSSRHDFRHVRDFPPAEAQRNGRLCESLARTHSPSTEPVTMYVGLSGVANCSAGTDEECTRKVPMHVVPGMRTCGAAN